MKHSRGIDNDGSIFQFDADDIPDSSKAFWFDPPSSSTSPSSTYTPSAYPSSMMDLDHSEHPDHVQGPCSMPSDTGTAMGEGLVEPVPIPVSTYCHDSHDSPSSFAPSPQGSHYLSLPSTPFSIEPRLRNAPGSLSIASSSYDHHSLSHLPGPSAQFHAACSDGAPASLDDKGKARELPPTLPPLSFSPSDFGYNTANWPVLDPSSPTQGPSSCGSRYTSLHTASSSHSQPSSLGSAGVQEGGSSNLRRIPSRTRSLSNLSIHSARSQAAQSLSKMKVKFGSSSKAPVNLARRLLSRNKADAADPSVTELASDSIGLLGDDLVPVVQESCFFPWQMNDNPSSLTPGAELEAPDATRSGLSVVWHPDNRRPDGIMSLRGKSRSYSSPFPKSAFDIVLPHGPEDVFMPLPLHTRNLFDEMLPRELRLHVFSALISLHEADHERLKSSAQWTILKASSTKNRWVGRDRAVRELVKFSRVSKAWRTLVFDGQLWQYVDLRAFPKMSSSFFVCLAEFLGPFTRNIDLSGHAPFPPTALVDMASSLCVRSAPTMGFIYTQLTAINLQGCTALTTPSLHSLLVRSPFLRSLDVKGLQAVTNTTFDVLALCSHLTSLNMSRCMNIDGEGVRAFGAAVMARGASLSLKELRLCGLADIDDAMLATLGKAAPHLEVLDLSYCSSLHNSALGAFVSCTDEEKDVTKTVSLTSRDAGRDPSDSRRHRRRVTALRHLSLSNCVLLTDVACSNLAHTVPQLEFLELAGIGASLKDDGLMLLLATTPFIRRLDLEDASDITDVVLEALTPQASETEGESSSGSAPTSKPPDPPQPGHALEHLTVSYAVNLSNDGFVKLIRACPKLRVLEVDSTCISGVVLKEFVRLVRQRGINDAGLVAVDCRLVGEGVVKEVASRTRPRKGWRSWDARKLGYLDARDGEDIKIGQDECDEKRVVLKSFYSWQTVDAVQAVREKRKRKANRKAHNGSSDQLSEPDDVGSYLGRTRWWAPSSRRSSGNNTPGREAGDRDGCVVM
ncbi:RNI-like protein [Paxillus ammoniavirescens]|nr:RNI-like protein [Paxillus ammoniavirescens]